MSPYKNKWLFYYDLNLKEIVQAKLGLLGSSLELLPFKNIKEIKILNKKIVFIAVSDLSFIQDLHLKHPIIVFFKTFRVDENVLVPITQNNLLEGCFDLDNVLKVLDPYLHNQSGKMNSISSESIKEINLFTERVSKVESLSELLLELKHEFRSIKKINSTLLAVNKFSDGLDLLFFQGEKIRTASLNAHSEEGSRMRMNQQQDRNLLAATLGRPIAKILAVPILGGVNPVTIFIEHDLNEVELSSILDFISRRLQVIETILDVLLIERRLNEASQLWEKTFEGISDPVAIVDKEFNLLRGNKKFRQFPKMKKCYEVFFDREEACSTCPLSNFNNKEDVTVGQIAGNKNSYEVHSSPIYLYNKTQVAGFANHYIDQTETLGLKSRIIQSEKMAAIGHLAGNIAHELNNPLTGIRSYSQLLIKEMKSESQISQDLLEVEKAAARCQKIITNLLEYTQVQQESLTNVSLNLVVEKTIPMLKSALYSYNLKIEQKNQTVIVKANEQLLQQVLFNLVLNSTQAMSDRGEIQITVAKDGKQAILKVKDNGPGIPRDIQDQVFEPFFTTKEKGKGTGLGLSMVKKVVESFAGKIKLISHPQQGTEITLYFPLQPT
ncbi:MAG: ATP-binding protein [Bdellovibrionaceae bacterium]|nr:ATP-binding protein [Pseudobdellovibrionaceae bacterium]